MTTEPTPSAKQKLEDDISELSVARAGFCLRALMMAGHVSEATMLAAIDLSATVRLS